MASLISSSISKKKDAASDGIPKCANCGGEGTYDNPLKKCSRCGLVKYCCRPCQAADWKNHKPLCVAKEDRKLSNVAATAAANEGATLAEENLSSEDKSIGECPICLASMNKDTKCTLPCSHSFHAKCVSRIRSEASVQACPLCRTNLPPGPEQSYNEGILLYRSYRDTVLSNGSETEEMKEMADKAIECLTAAAEEGHMMAQYTLSRLFFEADDQSKQGIKWLEKAAIQGDVVSQYNLGCMFNDGRGVPQSDEKAFHWHEKAAKSGMAESQFNVGNMYLDGRWVTQSYKKAFYWHEKSANQGFSYGQNALGMMFGQGQYVPLNYDKAREWFEKAANQGLDNAQYNIGIMFREGHGVKPDNDKAFYYYQKSAFQGHARAQHNLGYLYENGDGVTQNMQMAAKWYEEAARQGYASSQYNLGIFYHHGQGVPRNHKMALEWMRKAAAQGHLKAIRILNSAI